MYQFLCLFGPAVLTWLLRRKYSHRNIAIDKDNRSKGISTDSGINRSMNTECKDREKFLIVVAEIFSYAFVQMAVILLVCKPLGRVQLTILSDGRLDIQYGSIAVFISACLSVVLGFTAVKDIHKADKRLDQEAEIRPGSREGEADGSR